MKSVEITCNLKLDEKKLAQVELHSFQNVMTVAVGELQFLGKVLEDKEALPKSRAICSEFLKAISDLSKAKALAASWKDFQDQIFVEIESALTACNIKEEHKFLVQESKTNLERILSVIGVRVTEFMNRIDSPEKWKRFTTDEVISRLKQVLVTIAENSKGRYGIVFDSAQKGNWDYLVLIDVAGPEDGVINLPPILLDTLRDLTANARKYTEPGGDIESTLKENAGEVILTVSDNGRGIPENEIEKVVQFGVRGSNTKPSETKGGGYGLTKAAYVCQKFGGRMWIESELGIGTRVELNVPKAR